MPNRVFISYSSIDSEIVNTLKRVLDRARVPYFLDKKDIKWGDELTTKIAGGLATSSHLLVILSPASIRSQWVPYEIGQAVALKKQVLPFLTHPSLEIPAFLREFKFETDIENAALFFRDEIDRGPSSIELDPRPSPQASEDQRGAPAVWTRNWNDLEKAAAQRMQHGTSEGEIKSLLRSQGVSAADAEKIIRNVSPEKR